MTSISRRYLKLNTISDQPAPTLHGTRYEASNGSEIGTIIGNPDGTPFTINGVQLYLCILDAVYRLSNVPWNLYNVELGALTECYAFGTVGTLTNEMTEAQLLTVHFIKSEMHSSRYNTDVLLANADVHDVFSAVGCPQERACASLMTSLGITDRIAVPTGPVLARAWQQRAFVDTLDPTVAANPTKSLTNWGFNGTTNGSVFSSSYYSAGYAVYIRGDGYVFYALKYYDSLGFLPVIEIEA